MFTFYFFDPELHLNDTGSGITKKTKKMLSELKGFKFLATLALVFKKIKK